MLVQILHHQQRLTVAVLTKPQHSILFIQNSGLSIFGTLLDELPVHETYYPLNKLPFFAIVSTNSNPL